MPVSLLSSSPTFFCFGTFISLKFNICGVTRCDLLILDVGSMLVLILSVLVAGTVLKVRCLAVVDDADDRRNMN